MAFKLYLYDTDETCIGTGALASAYIQSQLEFAGGQDIEVHISSVGGSAFDAIAIYDLLKKYPGNVTTYIDALAASAASVVAMAGQTVIMSKYALLMIHKPMVGSGGNADELLKDVQMLNVVQTRLAQIYMDKTGLDEVTINSLINSVTWMTAEQALDLGFIDSIEEYDSEKAITNGALIKKYIDAAPMVYQRAINKILNIENKNPMNTENKDLIEKTASVLDKIMNFFKRTTNKVVTNSGELFIAPNATFAEGTEVFNDAELTTAAADGEHVYNKKKVTIKDGKVTNMSDDDTDTDPNEDDEDVENKTVLNNAGIKVTALAKGEVKNVVAKIKEIQNKLSEQNTLLAEARTALEQANIKLKASKEQIKNEIKSEFEPEGSKRSHKTVTEPAPDARIMPATDLAKNAVKHAMNSAKK